MTPPRTPKLSGAELAAQLAATSFPKAVDSSPAPPSAPAERPPETPLRAGKEQTLSKGGRPSKGGGRDAIPVNVRLSPTDHAALARVAYEQMTQGRPPPTVQDVLRRLVRGALNDPETLNRLVKEGEI